MADPIQQTTQINLPNPRTPLIVVKEGIGYPTREFMALLRQFSIRVGGTDGDVNIINPEADIFASFDSGSPQDTALSMEPFLLVSPNQLQEMVAHAVAVEMSMARQQTEQANAFAIEMTMGASFEPV